MKNLKSNKAITLIALIITIIVLLILAGVTINMVMGENGLINKAQNAVGKYENEQTKENTTLSDFEKEIDKYMQSGVTYTIASDADTSGGLSVGDEITDSQGENYFVIADNGSKVTLITKYNLSQAGTAQQNAAYSTTACAFSSNNYWSTSWATWKTAYDAAPSGSKPAMLNLNNESGYATGDAVDKAKKYGTAKGGTGRLLTYEEAKAIKDGSDASLKKILYGQDYATNPVTTNNYLYFWLGSALHNCGSDVWTVYGYSSGLSFGDYSDDNSFGVRPVIEISKSKIS